MMKGNVYVQKRRFKLGFMSHEFEILHTT